MALVRWLARGLIQERALRGQYVLLVCLRAGEAVFAARLAILAAWEAFATELRWDRLGGMGLSWPGRTFLFITHE